MGQKTRVQGWLQPLPSSLEYKGKQIEAAGDEQKEMDFLFAVRSFPK